MNSDQLARNQTIRPDNRLFRLRLVAKFTRKSTGPDEEEEIRRLKEAVSLSPNSGQLELQLGEMLRNRGRSREAFGHFLAAVRKGNLEKPVAAHRLIAYTGYELDEYEEALKAIAAIENTDEVKKDGQLPQLRRAIESARELRNARARRENGEGARK